jgi:hypothetical protein
MRYMRAVEQGNWHRAAEARNAFPGIVEHLGKIDDKDVLGRGLADPLHKWILDLARYGVAQEIDEVKKMQEEGDEYGASRGKENIIRQLKRLTGTSGGGIKAMKDDKGNIHTDTAGMISTLEEHLG